MKKFLKSPAAVIVLFAIAAAMILAGGIGGTIAWNNDPIYSDYYAARVEMKDIGVTLNENHEMVSHRDYIPESNYQWDSTGSTYKLCENLLGDDEQVKIGKVYDELLSVTNSGHIDEYVRVNVYKYWAATDENGNIKKDKNGVIVKRTDLDPSMIDLHFVTDGDWVEDTATQSDTERTTLYYTKVLSNEEGKNETPVFADTLKINDAVATKVLQTTYVDEEGYTVIDTTYDYDGAMFMIEAEVDAVQTHNAEAAILSAWGRNVTIDKATGDITAIK